MTPLLAQDARNTFWQEQISDWKHSGLSGAQYCKVNNLSYHQFVYWRQKILKPDKVREKENNQGGFAQAVCRPAPSESLSLSLPNGLVFRGIHAGNVGVVRDLLELM